MSLRNILFCILGLSIILLVIDIRQPLISEYSSLEHKIIPHLQARTEVPSDGPTFLAVGDIMLGRQVEKDMDSHGDEYPFQHIDSLLNSVTTVIANLEGPVLENHIPTPAGSFHFAFDTRMPEVLRDHNVGIVNLANNHTYDYGVDGFSQTMRYLDLAGVMHAGNPFAIGDQYVLRTTIDGRKFIFVSFNFTNPGFDTNAAHAFVKSIPKAPDEYLIAMVHGGTEYDLHSTPAQETFYRGLIDDGVDLVLAHHPHVVEEIEQYKGKLIFYSLGNFIFDQYFSSDVQEELAVKIHFSATLTHFALVPLESVNSQPELMDEADAIDFLKQLSYRSSSSLQQAIQAGSIDISSQ